MKVFGVHDHHSTTTDIKETNSTSLTLFLSTTVTCLLLTQPFLYNGYNSTGTKNWDSLLDPLDQSRRQLILRCGDFCQAATAKSSFFEKVILEHTSDYEVTSFLYATARRSLPPRFAPPLTGLLPRSQASSVRSTWFWEGRVGFMSGSMFWELGLLQLTCCSVDRNRTVLV